MLPEHYSMAAREKGRGSKKQRKGKDLPWWIYLAKGMKVMVTDNVKTDLDVTNGTWGEIVDIILHPDEPPISNDPVVHLKYLPAYLLVKLACTQASQLKGLDKAVIPIEPAMMTMGISVPTPNCKVVTHTVWCRQYPIVATYTFMDYRSQGQTLPHVIIDIASPPTGTLTLFNLYVALSRSSRRDTIHLLCDFDKNLFKWPHNTALMEEDDRLEELNRLTLHWWERMGGIQRWEEMRAAHSDPPNDNV